jgi:TPR repeat protein
MVEGTYNSDTAADAFQAKAYDRVLQLALPHAEAGNPDAQCTMSLMYQGGLGVHRDLREAERWLLLATAQDSAAAWNNLGTLYICAGQELSNQHKSPYECFLEAKRLGFVTGDPYPPAAKLANNSPVFE